MRSRSLILFLPVAALVAAAAARADGPSPAPPSEVELAGTLGDCGATPPKLTAVPGQGFRLDFDGLRAEVDAATPFGRKACAVALKVAVPVGFRVQRSSLTLAGAADLGAGNLAARVTAAYYGDGEEGASLFKALAPSSGHADITEYTPDAPAWLACAAQPQVTVEVEAVAAARPASDPTNKVDPSTVTIAAVTVPPLLYKRCDP